MNYTENYHLPQWEKSDRIMMDDFNRMCADTEAGIIDTRNDVVRQLCRLAYNHYRAVRCMEVAPSQAGIVWQSPMDAGATLDGMAALGGACCLSRGEDFYGGDINRNWLKRENLLFEAGKVTQPMTLVFAAKGTGMLTCIFLQINYTDGNATDTPLELELVMEDLTRKRVAAKTRLTLHYPSQKSDVALPIIRSHLYQITVKPVDPPARPGNVQVVSGVGEGYDNDIHFSCLQTGENGSAAITFHDPEENTGALLAATFWDLGPDGTWSEPTMRWNGEEIRPMWVRTLVDHTGNEVLEAVYVRNTPVKEGDRAEIGFACAEGHDVEFCEWCICWL